MSNHCTASSSFPSYVLILWHTVSCSNLHIFSSGSALGGGLTYSTFMEAYLGLGMIDSFGRRRFHSSARPLRPQGPIAEECQWYLMEKRQRVSFLRSGADCVRGGGENFRHYDIGDVASTFFPFFAVIRTIHSKNR